MTIPPMRKCMALYLTCKTHIVSCRSAVCSLSPQTMTLPLFGLQYNMLCGLWWTVSLQRGPRTCSLKTKQGGGTNNWYDVFYQAMYFHLLMPMRALLRNCQQISGRGARWMVDDASRYSMQRCRLHSVHLIT